MLVKRDAKAVQAGGKETAGRADGARGARPPVSRSIAAVFFLAVVVLYALYSYGLFRLGRAIASLL